MPTSDALSAIGPTVNRAIRRILCSRGKGGKGCFDLNAYSLGAPIHGYSDALIQDPTHNMEDARLSLPYKSHRLHEAEESSGRVID